MATETGSMPGGVGQAGPRLGRLAAAAALIVVACVPALMPGTLGLDPGEGRAAALMLAAVGLWATGLLPEPVTAIGFFALAMLMAVAPPATVFAGFASQAFWLVFAGLVLSLAAAETGLARRLARLPLDFVARSYPRIITASVLLGLGSAFLVPSAMGRVALLVPVLLAIADRLGLVAGRPGRNGLLIAFILSTYYLPLAILPANVPNVVLAGAVETIYGQVIGYGTYLAIHLPVLALLKVPVIVWVVVRLFPDRTDGAEPALPAEPLQRPAVVLAVVFALTLLGWSSDSLHGIAPAWVGLAAALVCLLPGLKLAPAGVFAGRLNVAPLFYVAAVLGIATLVSTTGIGAVLSRALLSVLPIGAGADFVNYLSLSGTAAVLGLVATMPGAPAVLTPLAGDLAASTGWALEAVVMTPVVGVSLALLPYQVPPIVVGLHLAGIELRRAAAPMLAISAISLLTLVPLNYLWWRWLGLIG